MSLSFLTHLFRFRLPKHQKSKSSKMLIMSCNNWKTLGTLLKSSSSSSSSSSISNGPSFHIIISLSLSPSSNLCNVYPKGAFSFSPNFPLAGHGVGRDASGSFGTTSRWQGVGTGTCRNVPRAGSRGAGVPVGWGWKRKLCAGEVLCLVETNTFVIKLPILEGWNHANIW